MAEQIQWARLTDLAPVIKALRWPAAAYMYLERAPELWLSDAEVVAGVRLEVFDPQTQFGEWERGRVFCADFELRWEKLDGAYQTVVVGNTLVLNNFTPANEMGLAMATVQKRGYLLWGKRMKDDQLSVINAEHKPNSQVYLELRIPRILRYPVSPNARQTQLNVFEYVDPKSGDLLYYRFVGLEELQ